jgi:hypothetical protein
MTGFEILILIAMIVLALGVWYVNSDLFRRRQASRRLASIVKLKAVVARWEPLLDQVCDQSKEHIYRHLAKASSDLQSAEAAVYSGDFGRCDFLLQCVGSIIADTRRGLAAGKVGKDLQRVK